VRSSDSGEVEAIQPVQSLVLTQQQLVQIQALKQQQEQKVLVHQMLVALDHDEAYQLLAYRQQICSSHLHACVDLCHHEELATDAVDAPSDQLQCQTMQQSEASMAQGESLSS
jgi:hypothetical protein